MSEAEAKAARVEPKDVWQFNEYEVSVGERGLVFKTKKTTAEVGWRHIVSAEHEIHSGIRVPVLVAGIALIILGIFFYMTLLLLVFLLSGVILIIASIRRKKFIGRIKVATGDTYQLSGEAAQLEEFLSMIRKKVWGK